MKAVVTGATGFLGGHVTRLLLERGDDVRVTYRNPERLKHLKGLDVRRAKADVLDYAEHSIAAGTDAQAAAYVEVQGPDGAVCWGVGVH